MRLLKLVLAGLIVGALCEFSSPNNQHSESVTLTLENGRPVSNMRDSLTVGPRGPVLLEDVQLFERNSLFNRERIPERVVHARGTTAFGTFKVTHDMSYLTAAKFLSKVGKETPIAIRFSTVTHGRESPEFLRDPRGFAVKFYTEEGNYDMAGLNFPVFWTRDGLRFPELVHALRPNPVNGRQEWWRILDFLANYPESTNILTYVLDDDGIPATYRHLDGFSLNAFVWTNARNQSVLVKYTFISQQGHVNIFDEDEAGRMKFDYATRDLYDSIENRRFPSWDFYVQVLTDDLISSLGFDPLDPTKHWLPALVPLRKVGTLTLDKNVGSQFLDNELIAFAPGRFVPGIGPSEDKLLQSRLVAYQDTQRYRLGVNNLILPVNRPKCPFANTHSDGFMNPLPGESEREVNYFPSLAVPRMKQASPQPFDRQWIQGFKTRESIRTVNEFQQPGDRFRSWDSDRKMRFAWRVAYSLAGDRCPKAVRNRWLAYWGEVDRDLLSMIKSVKADTPLTGPGLQNMRTCDGATCYIL